MVGLQPMKKRKGLKESKKINLHLSQILGVVWWSRLRKWHWRKIQFSFCSAKITNGNNNNKKKRRRKKKKKKTGIYGNGGCLGAFVLFWSCSINLVHSSAIRGPNQMRLKCKLHSKKKRKEKKSLCTVRWTWRKVHVYIWAFATTMRTFRCGSNAVQCSAVQCCSGIKNQVVCSLKQQNKIQRKGKRKSSATRKLYRWKEKVIRSRGSGRGEGRRKSRSSTITRRKMCYLLSSSLLEHKKNEMLRRSGPGEEEARGQ